MLGARLWGRVRAAATLALVALVLLPVAPGVSARTPPATTGGVLDLRDWDFARDGPIGLGGQWDLVWGRFEDPDLLGGPGGAPGVPVAVPGPWNEVTVDGRPVGPWGHGTYRLILDCYQASGLALALPVQHSAMRLHVNGRLVARQGSPAASADVAQAAQQTQIVYLDGLSCPLRVVVHVSNFDVRRGGLVRSIEMGTREQLHGRREQALVRDVFALGAFGLMTLLALMFHASRRGDRGPLYFGLFCLTFALGLGLAGGRVLEPWVAPWGWNAYLRLAFLSWYASVSFFALFLGSTYPQHVRGWPLRAVVWWALASCAIVLATGSAIYSQLVPLLQAGAALVAAWLFVSLLRVFASGQRNALWLIGGLVVLVAAIVHDTVQFEYLQRRSLVSYGLFVFAVAPALLLAQRVTRALRAEELRSIEQRERADLLVRSTQAGLLDWDATTGVMTFSDRYRQILGYRPDSPVWQQPFYELVHPDERDAVRDRFTAQLRDRSVRSAVRQFEPMEFRMARADGEPVWIHAEGIGLNGADGRTLRMITSIIDITAHKRQETELSNRIKFTNDLFDSLPLALALRDAEGRYLVVNRTWERYIGLSRDSVIGSSLHGVDDPAAAATLALDREALDAGPQVQLPPIEYDYNGRRLMQTRTVMVDSAGHPIGVLVASLDITDKHAAEEALAVERERLRLLVRSTKAGFGDWDARSDVVNYTDRFKEMLGYPPDFDTAQWGSIFDLMHPDDRERAREEFRAMLRRKPRGGEQVPGASMSYRLRRLDGSYVWIHAEGISQVDDDGRTQRFITSYLDVTRFHNQEEALRASRDQIAAQASQLELQNEMLKENVRLREEVERIGRHDIKTPLNSIIAVPRLLREERSLSADQDDLLGVVERAGYRILSMVNLSLDLYKMENGSYIFRPDAVDLRDLVDKVWADLRSHAASKEVTLHIEESDAPAHAWGEELLCYSLLANLLKNAVEAAPQRSGVHVRFRHEWDTIVTRIRNDGEVPLSVRAQFFQKYATAGKASGTGLGTYSARLMARVQDGDLVMESGGGGTTLTVRLRAAAPGQLPVTVRHVAERKAAPARAADLPPLRVLLVDDDEYNLLIVKRFLPSPPFTVATAINGRVALEQAAAAWPDFIFMDLDMPVMGGIETVGRLRGVQRDAQAPPCAMVALSSHDDEQTQQRALHAGFDAYLTKPVSRETLEQCIRRLHGEAGSGAARVAPSADVLPAAAPEPALAEPDLPEIDEDLRELLPAFLASRGELVEEMIEALADGKRDRLRRAAHRLAGSLAMYGCAWAAEHCRDIELAADAIEPGDLAVRAQALMRHIRRLEARLQAAAVPGGSA
jgi:PAS domain S-box-containing protein